MRKAFAALFLCGCGAGEPGIVDIHNGAGGGDAVHESGGTGGVETCDSAPRPRRLRQVRVGDSRALEPNTLVLATVPEPQTFWLPRARESLGAVIVVKEAIGVDRRITVDTNGADVFHGLGTGTHDTSVAWASRTFVATTDDADVPAWVLLDAVE